MRLYKKGIFPLRISSVNVTKSAVTCGLTIFTEEIRNGKLHFYASFTCSKSTTETLEKYMKYGKVFMSIKTPERC